MTGSLTSVRYPVGDHAVSFALPPTLCPSPQHADILRPLSFGDPNARPPTPQPTPTAVFSSPLLQTPKQNASGSSHFDDTSGWTPRFAEEYSVFNSTPGNLRGSSSGAAFNNLFAPLSPVPQSTGTKRSLSPEATAVDVTAHANHFATAPATLAPVIPVRRLSCSPEPQSLLHENASVGPSNATRPASPAQAQQGHRRSAKKPRRASVSSAAAKSPFLAQRQTQQTATPPPSSRGGRKLAPKPQAASMQNQAFPQPDFSSAPPQQPQLNTNFVTGVSEDVFGYPIAPATAPPVAAPRPYWGFDLDTSGMAIDVDLSAAGTDLFQSPAPNQAHRQMSSMEWARTNQMFEQAGMEAPSNQQQEQQEQKQVSPQQQNQSLPLSQAARRGRPLAPKTPNIPTPNMQSPSQSFHFGQYQMSMDSNPFTASSGGVDPGILFSQPPLSAGTDSNSMTMSMSMAMSMAMDSIPQPTSSAPANMEHPTTNLDMEPLASAAPVSVRYTAPRSEGRDFGSGPGQGQQHKQSSRPRAISPTKNPGRPSLSRSFSESARGGKRTVGGGRNPLPALAPARPLTVHQPNLPPPSQMQGGPSSGRRSPLKPSQHHRLSSLTSIPENVSHLLGGSRRAKRTSVKFVIDENGRARAETIADEDDEPEPESESGIKAMLPISSSQLGNQRNSWAGPPSVSTPVPVDDEEYSSSSDDEPIIIPSRNTSFAYPEPPESSGSSNSRPPTSSSIFSQIRMRHRSFSDRPFLSQSSHLDPTHDIMDVDPPQRHQHQQPRPSTGGSLGDAAAELRKVMQAENPRRPSSGQHPPPPLSSADSSGHRQRFTPGQRSSSSTISEASLPATSPNQGREQSQVRCVCNRPEAGDATYLVKWYVRSFYPLVRYLGLSRALYVLFCFVYSFLH